MSNHSTPASELARSFATRCNICTHSGIWNLGEPIFGALLAAEKALSQHADGECQSALIQVRAAIASAHPPAPTHSQPTETN